MILPDVNLLLYAVDSHSPLHAQALHWWSQTLNSGGAVGLPWHCVVGFLRISTNPRIMKHPLSEAEAVQTVKEWLALANVRVLATPDDHFDSWSKLIVSARCKGDLIPDSYLAALAIAHGATLCSTDTDFARFDGLKWRNPIKAPK